MTYPSGTWENSFLFNTQSKAMNETRIVILTSHEVLGSIIAYRLELLGKYAMRISSGDELEMIMSSTKVPLVIVDLDNCDGLGMTIVEKISASERNSEVAILCLSAEGDLTVADAANRAGADDFLVVPFDMLVLEEKVSKLLNRMPNSNEQPDIAAV
jgi:DNA-binding response OmpR family regulator